MSSGRASHHITAEKQMEAAPACSHVQITSHPFLLFHRPLIINVKEHTFAIREDSHAVNVVGVAVIDLCTFACGHQPSSDTRVIAA